MNTKSILKKSFRMYLNKGYFFNTWYRENNTSYYFTFKENLSRTNIQYAELKSLIVSNIHDADTKEKCNVQFLTVQEFNTSIDLIISSFPPTEPIRQKSNSVKKIKKETIDFLVDNHFDMLSKTVVIDPFYNSCCVYLPPNINIDPKWIVSMSGYIFTCGELIYIRNFKKAKKQVLINSLARILKDKKEVDFNIFSYEDFKHTLKNGYNIENLKIHIDKFYFDSKPLNSLLYDLETSFEKKLKVRFFYDQKEEALKSNTNSIWLVKDSSIGKEIKFPGENNYFICFLQLYKNDNQLHFFDENKPAWKSNTTIPHSLIAAMINIALEGKGAESKIETIDPFLGTGTTIIELLKYKSFYKNMSIYGADLFSSSKIMLYDNLSVFSYSALELQELINRIIKNKNNCFDETVSLVTIYDLLSHNQEELEIDEHKIKSFQNITLYERLLIYVFLKVKITEHSAIFRKADKYKVHFFIELDKLIDRLNLLKKQLEILPDTSQTIHDGFNLLKGKFSSKISINSEIYTKGLDIFALNCDDFIYKDDFRNLCKKRSYDIIICDPPYGFNTTHNIEALFQLYNDLPRALLSALKPYGQIVMSLPDESYSGKHSPWFTHKEMVINGFHYMAQELGSRIINFSEINPSRKLFSAPFYWEAQRALRRSIIHLKILKNPPV